MEQLLPGIIMSFREGIEALLIAVILLEFLARTGKTQYISSVYGGIGAGVSISFLFGIGLFWAIDFFGLSEGTTAKLWESGASFVAAMLVSTFLYWMIVHQGDIRKTIENKASLRLSRIGVLLLTSVLILREGVEIALFTFAGNYTATSVLIGLSLAVAAIIAIRYSIVKIPLGTLLSITMGYLILQVGYLLGYSVHEFLSASKGTPLVEGMDWLYAKVYNLSDTIFFHKEGIIGVPMNIFLGWYSKPEWIQFIIQYGYTLSFLWIWKRN